ncbi:discoidin domain-containing protein [Aquimarina sp. AU58]|uniref:discoidin domain-containing protein n=1 Tax=Aquimarina sp. AU58 TaxID=1874112 RepID=UPI000D6452EC|nr:discoidin domain-containing protein [Aquimarina sp. AU58]
MKTKLYLSIFLIFGLFSCSKEKITEDLSVIKLNSVKNINTQNQHTLNVVFFEPTDVSVNQAFLDRVSNVMLYIQEWYAVQMDAQGYGKKTFGLNINSNGKVKLIKIKGKKTSSEYSKNRLQIKGEVNNYFRQNPSEKDSQHIFVLGKEGSGLPFVGVGKMAFASSKNFKLEPTGKYFNGFELKKCDKLGGIMHELGHGLNLPHMAHRKSDLPNISLMSFGNRHYQRGNEDETFLLPSSCALLNVSQTFNSRNNGINYYGNNPGVNMVTYEIKKENNQNAIIAEGKFTSSVRPTHIYIGHNGYPKNGNGNPRYDEVTFTTTPGATRNVNEYSFRLVMPYSDIFNGYQDNNKNKMALSVYVVTENGRKSTPLQYDYTTDVSKQTPNDDVNKSDNVFSHTNRSAWTITANSKSGNNIASRMIDGDKTTFWHSMWPYIISSKGNHVITANFNEWKYINGIYLLSDKKGRYFRPKSVKVETSYYGDNWTVMKHIHIASENEAREIKINFGQSIWAQHLRIIVDEVYSSTSAENLSFSEIDITE